MKYPAIVYSLDDIDTRHADNTPYKMAKRYQLTVMDRSPDSPLVMKVAGLPSCSFQRWFAADGLNHWVYTLYY